MQTRTIQRSREEAPAVLEIVKDADAREFAMPLSAQIFTVTKRRFTAYWRMPTYIAGKMLLHVFTGTGASDAILLSGVSRLILVPLQLF